MTTHLVMQNSIAMTTTASLVQPRKKINNVMLSSKNPLATANIPPDARSGLPVAVCASWNFFSVVVVAGIRSGVGAPLPAARSLCSVVLMRGCEFPHAPPPVREPGWQWCKACLRAGSSPSTHHRADHFGLYSAPLLLQRSSFASRGFLNQETLSNGFFFFSFCLTFSWMNPAV